MSNTLFNKVFGGYEKSIREEINHLRGIRRTKKMKGKCLSDEEFNRLQLLIFRLSII